MHRAFTFVLLFAVWIVFSGQLDSFHLTLGLISCAIVTWMSSNLLFDKESDSISHLMGILFRMPPYLIWLLYEIFFANIHVLYLALFPGGIKHVRPQVVEFQTKLKSDYARLILANSITLTPGTVTIKMEGPELLVHSISLKTTISLEGNMEKRIAHIFGEDLKDGGSAN